MLTFYLWKEINENFSWSYSLDIYETFWNVLAGIVFTPIFVLLDIILSPIEIISLIIYKRMNK